jgi:hypothetical protein
MQNSKTRQAGFQPDVVACRVRPRKNFLSVLNRSSQVMRVQREQARIQAIDNAPRQPQCIDPSAEQLTKNRRRVK